MATFRRSVRYYVKNGKRLMDINLGRGQGYITLSSTFIQNKIKYKKKRKK